MKNRGSSILLMEPSSHVVSMGDVAMSPVNEMTTEFAVNTLTTTSVAVNIAVIPVHGYLMHRNSYHWPGWFTGYTFIENALMEAVSDDSIDGIVLDVDSGGGMVDGAFELAETIRELGKLKPIRSIIDSHAYSAAYLVAAATGYMSVPKTGGVGSIGVVTKHTDYSKAMESAGVVTTYLYKGSHKVDGNPYQALSDSARKNIEEQITSSYDMFIESVAIDRGITIEAVRNTEAATFQGSKALDVGLVDAVMAPKEAYSVFALELSKNTVGGIEMTTENNNAVEASDAEGTTIDTTVLKQEGSRAENSRIKGILTHADAEGRTDLAQHLAFDTNMSVEAAVGILSKTPIVAAVATPEADTKMDFNQAMSEDNPNINAEVEGGNEVNAIDAMLSAHTAATGKQH